MLIRTGEARTQRMDLGLAGLLSLVAGALNAAGFVVAGSFTANQTGNLSMVSETLVQGQVLLALSFAGLVLAFITGAALAALGIQWGERLGVRETYALAVAAEAAILLGLGALLAATGGPAETHVVIVLSFVMGLQNAVTTVISRARVRTTHVSGMATDIGIELAALLGSPRLRDEARPKLALHSLTLACFAVGGVLGTLAYAIVGHWLFTATGVLLAAIALPELALARRD